MRIALSAILATVLLSSMLGCTAWQHAPRDYVTVPADAHRDRDGAVAQTEEAARHMANGKVAKAEQCLQEALIADVSYGPAHNNLGLIFYEQGKYYLAAWEFEFAKGLMSGVASPSNNLGMVYEAVDRLDEAVKYYESAYEMDPRNPEIIGNLARARLKRDEQDPRSRALLADLIMHDTRPNWTTWARERLALTDWAAKEQPTAASYETISDIPATPEAIPRGPVMPPGPPTNQAPAFGLPYE